MFPELEEGVSLCETSSGTNAVALSLKFHRQVMTLPQHHYCLFLESRHIYAIPVCSPRRFDGCLALITEKRSITRELVALTRLFAHSIETEMTLLSNYHAPGVKAPDIRLSGQQKKILICLANGMTDKAAAVEMHICFDTVKYHKRNLFKNLDATCGTQAVVKALKNGLISLYDIDL